MNSDLSKSWLTLLVLQVLVALLVFSDFLTGKVYFAYFDIGSDSYFQVFPSTVQLALTMLREGFTGWSFRTGLGGPTSVNWSDLASLLSQLVGAENILSTRIYFYLLKIVLGGSFFLLFIRHHVKRWESAVIGALAYSFCGFMVINGQWDGEATAFVFYPLVLWAINRHLRTGDVLTLPLVIASTLLFGVFFVSLGVFLIFTCAAFIACDNAPSAMLKRWMVRILPLTALGYLLAGPYLLPVILQLADSSRVSGGQSLIQDIFHKSVGVNSVALVISQIGGMFHKDIYGVGSAYRGYFNYLEGPGFFIGIALFLIIPQLWGGTRADKRLVAFAAIAFIGYIIFPVFRYAAMGFAAPYFRISTLWVSIMGLTLATIALNRVLNEGVNGRLLLAGLALFTVLLATTVFGAVDDTISTLHVVKIVGLACLATSVLALSQSHILSLQRLPLFLLLVIVIEIVVIARPSYVEGRSIVSPKLRAYDDQTPAALEVIKVLDSGVFRVEKNFTSVSFADSLYQDYMGIKSYSLHSRGMVDFHIGAGLIAPRPEVVNYSNWLPNAGPRYMLNSLLGVKYIIAKEAVTWPGFVEISNSTGLRIYRNDLALPFGFVQSRQITKEALAEVSTKKPVNTAFYLDAALLNAALVDHTIPKFGNTLDLDALVHADSLFLQEWYFSPVAELQRNGLKLESFSSNRITGKISPASSGILVFSIPFSDGWRLKIDGKVTPMFRVNFGMLGAPVGAGKHKVELVFEIPGQHWGWFLGATGLAFVFLIVFFERRRGRSR